MVWPWNISMLLGFLGRPLGFNCRSNWEKTTSFLVPRFVYCVLVLLDNPMMVSPGCNQGLKSCQDSRLYSTLSIISQFFYKIYNTGDGLRLERFGKCFLLSFPGLMIVPIPNGSGLPRVAICCFGMEKLDSPKLMTSPVAPGDMICMTMWSYFQIHCHILWLYVFQKNREKIVIPIPILFGSGKAPVSAPRLYFFQAELPYHSDRTLEPGPHRAMVENCGGRFLHIFDNIIQLCMCVYLQYIVLHSYLLIYFKQCSICTAHFFRKTMCTLRKDNLKVKKVCLDFRQRYAAYAVNRPIPQRKITAQGSKVVNVWVAEEHLQPLCFGFGCLHHRWKARLELSMTRARVAEEVDGNNTNFWSWNQWFLAFWSSPLLKNYCTL